MRPSLLGWLPLLVLAMGSPIPAQSSSGRARVSGPPRAIAPEGGHEAVGPGTVLARRKISSEGGLPSDTLDGDDLLGSSVACLGDVDGDGVDDVAVGIQAFQANGGLFDGLTIEGAVHVLFLESDGGVKGFRRIDDHAGTFAGQLGSGDRFGAALAPLGDLDGNGVPDLAAATARDCGTCETLFVLFLEADGSVGSFVRHQGFRRVSLASVGDLDGDGLVDLAAGIPEDTLADRGAVEILFFDEDGSIRDRQRIDEDEGGFTGTLADDDGFGASVAGLGDLDGDGIGDLAVGASGNGGAVWILFLNGDGTVAAHVESTPFAGLGASLAAVGDLDGDGVIELAAGVPRDDDGGFDRGATWILFLESDGSVAAAQKISSVLGGFVNDLANGDEFGSALAGLGDLDGDGLDDLAVGAPFDDDNQGASGALWILFLDTNGSVRNEAKISDRPGSFESTLDPLDWFGRSATVVGDLDHDGIPELAIGASRDDDGGLDRGAVWIVFPDPSGAATRVQKISDTHGEFAGTLVDEQHFGHAVERLGDLDGDGVEDLGVGSPRGGRGTVWILFLEPDGTVKGHREIGNTTGGFGGGLGAGARFGSSLACLGDLDGDGTLELAVGAPQQDQLVTNDGALWVLSLDATGFVQSEQRIAAGVGGFGGVLASQDQFGAALASLGDLDGDGVGDLAVGAVREEESFPFSDYASGAVWILFLNADRTVRSHVRIDEGEGGFTGTLADGDLFARSLASLGDLDGDGVTELAVGAPRDEVGAIDPQGAVWILFLDASGHVRAHRKIADSEMGGELNADVNFGSALAALGDQNGDGVRDLLVGSREEWAGGNHGAYWLLALDGVARVGFEHGDDAAGTPLENGRSLAAPGAFGRVLAVEGSGANLGPAVFDSTPLGPNDPSQDRDLLVGKENLLILQNSQAPTQTVPGIFDRPNDDQDGGVLAFAFQQPSEPLSLVLVDIDAGASQFTTVRLLDASGRARTYSVPPRWTEDLLTDGPPGWRTLDLTTLDPQPGHAATATASEASGFDPRTVVRIEVALGSSGGVDDLTWDPHPD